MIATDLKTGVIYQEDGQPWQVEKYSHHKTARSGATVKVFVRNLITGETRQKNYLGNNKVEDAFVERKTFNICIRITVIFLWILTHTINLLSLKKL